MFEVIGSDIARLSDTDLRSLVVRLATSELRKQGLPLASVTAGGHQDAADGGLDVRVECLSALPRADFVPRQHTGFQVKKPDMAARAIKEEMRPKGTLRSSIAELAKNHGAYVIVSAQGSVADRPLRERRQAMRDQLIDLASPEDLYTDFYDRDRLAAWVNEHPGIAAWVRASTDRPLDGWSSIDRWGGPQAERQFLTDSTTCLVDERRKPGVALPMLEGVELLRTELRCPGRCVRLIGLSGLGKTRLVQALFEKGVGGEPLDPGLAIYTDYATDTRPSARDMARELIGLRQPVILIVDNCNPETHSELAKLCADSGAPIGLLTVEYDVREDEPEHTDVFRLQAASSGLIEVWLEQNFDHISQVDRRTIAEFSHGNFRVARALAETLRRGETLGQVRSRDLFERIFRQRNIEDKSLLMCAEDLALAYSVNGDDIGPDGELAQLASIRGVETRELFEALAELRRRDVAQVRGRWRAILPQAIANGLAANALARIHPEMLDDLVRSAGSRLLISLSRRLGNLHDSPEARDAVKRWLVPGGAMGDLFSGGGNGLGIVTNLAPIAPEHVLHRIGSEVDAHSEVTAKSASHRWDWIRLIKALAYDPECFIAAAMLLARFVAAEPEGNNTNSGRESFAELFHLYLSGTEAPPSTRREVIKELLKSNNPAMAACGLLALKGMLKTSNFSSSSSFDFGARSRTWGWRPSVNREVWDWYVEAINLCVTAADQFEEAPRILSGSARDLWRHQFCHDALEGAVDALLQKGAWIEGWLALRATLRFDGAGMPPAWRDRLVKLIDRLKPVELIHRARAAALGRGTDGWDISDGEADDQGGVSPWERASRMAEDVGRELALDPTTRSAFMAELMVAGNDQRAFECGLGLADGAVELDSMWKELLSDLKRVDAAKRNPTVIGGFLGRARGRDARFTERALEEVMHNSAVSRWLPYLQARVGMDESGIERLRRALAVSAIGAQEFWQIANGVVEHSPPEPLAHLLSELASLPGGEVVALEILYMYFLANSSTADAAPWQLLDAGRRILFKLDPRQISDSHAHGIAEVAKICCSGKDTTISVSFVGALRSSLVRGEVDFYEIRDVVKALCEVQPRVVLDTFLLASSDDDDFWRWDMGGRKGLPYKSIGSLELQAWASVDPNARYGVLGPAMSLFGRSDFEEGAQIDPLFEGLLALAPDRAKFLGSFYRQVHLNRWNGSLKAILEDRRLELLRLAKEMTGDVAEWVKKGMPELDRWIEDARGVDHDQEESFE
ncbi:hypothetical protein [Stenotrophomonas sp. PD6]|uniref:hypothetical protein n=1 Tax=Stenotrophomonas sp. PD6 TaxID=3368612 RepID=UPI003B9DF04F